MKKLLTIFLTLCICLSFCFTSIACKPNDDVEHQHNFVEGVCSVCGEEEVSDLPSATQPTSEEKMLADTLSAFNSITDYSGSYTLSGTLNENFASTGTISVDTNIPDFPLPDIPEIPDVNEVYNVNVKDTYDGETKRFGLISNDDGGENCYYIPNGTGYIRYTKKGESKTYKSLTPEEIKNEVFTLSEGLEDMFGIKMSEVKTVTSKEGLITLLQNGAKEMAKKYNKTTDFTWKVTFDKYEIKSEDDLLIYSFDYKLKHEGENGIGSADETYTLYVKDGKLVKIGIVIDESYDLTFEDVEYLDEDEELYLKTTQTFKGKTIVNALLDVSYEYEDVIPTDFSEYVAEPAI